MPDGSVPAMAAIEVRDLVVGYGSTTAVAGITFSGEPGQVLALLGPNGAGKTTTVETLEGYRTPTSGQVRILGLDPVGERRSLMPQIGVMLQRGGVYPSMNPAEVLRLFAAYYDDPDDPGDLLERVELQGVAGTPWRRLSGGEQQRLSLALALVGRPKVALLDEPTAGVDPAGRLAIRQVIRDLRDGGTCVVLTTHELEEAERLADHIVILDRGVVVAAGSPRELMSSGAGESIRFGAPPALDCAGLGAAIGAEVAEDRPGEYLVHAAATPATVAAVTAWLAENNLPLADLRAGRHTLEDVFLRLTGQPSAAETDRAPRSRRRREARR